MAYKQKRFPRAIASDIQGLLALGRTKGLASGLCNRLEYLWSSCSGAVSAQSDLYRLTYAIEQLKSQGWVNVVVSDGDWGGGRSGRRIQRYRCTAGQKVGTDQWIF